MTTDSTRRALAAAEAYLRPSPGTKPLMREIRAEFVVSNGAIVRASYVLRGGRPELLAALRAGEISLSAAADIAQLPADEQLAEMGRRTQRRKFTAPATARTTSDRAVLDRAMLQHIADSFDAIAIVLQGAPVLDPGIDKAEADMWLRRLQRKARSYKRILEKLRERGTADG